MNPDHQDAAEPPLRTAERRSGRGVWRCLGIAGALRATGYSWQGLRHAARHERAFRQELALLIVLTPLACWLPVSGIERLLLVVSMLLVLAVELLNSAVEAGIDLISPTYHELAKQAKDMGSAAVFIALAISLLTWVTIAGPLLLNLARAFLHAAS